MLSNLDNFQLSSTSFGKGGSRPHSAEVNGIGNIDSQANFFYFTIFTGNHSKALRMEVKVVKATKLGTKVIGAFVKHFYTTRYLIMTNVV